MASIALELAIMFSLAILLYVDFATSVVDINPNCHKTNPCGFVKNPRVC
jgi:hypothetical protein